jgi:hypothetical protein
MSRAEEMAFVPAVVIGCGILVLIVWWVLAARSREERRIRRAVRRLGTDVLTGLEIPDGLDGRMYIDYLVLTAGAIFVVVVKRYEGLIYAGEKLAEWTQVVRQNNYRFPNPLKELELKIIALRSIVPDVPISGCVLFGERSSFPTRKPEGVMCPGDAVPAVDRRPVAAALQQAWRKLRQLRNGQ